MTEAEFAEQLNKALKVKEEQLADLRKHVAQMTADLQILCPHERVLEKPYKNRPDTFKGYEKAVRVCETCGLVEQGFHFSILACLPVANCTEDHVYKISRGPYHRAPGWTKEAHAAAIRKGLGVDTE